MTQEGKSDDDFTRPLTVFGKVPEARYKGDTAPDGKRHGHGTMHYAEGRVYSGDWYLDKMHGYGTITFPSGNTYTGEFQNDKKHGYGVFVFPDGYIYDGNYVDDMKEGFGTYYWPDGSAYQGGWRQNKKHGEGVMRHADTGQTERSLWDNGNPIN